MKRVYILLLVVCLLFVGCAKDNEEKKEEFSYEKEYGDLAKYYETTDNIISKAHMEIKEIMDEFHQVGDDLNIERFKEVSYELPSRDFQYEGVEAKSGKVTIHKGFKVSLKVNYGDVTCTYDERMNNTTPYCYMVGGK